MEGDAAKLASLVRVQCRYSSPGNKSRFSAQSWAEEKNTGS